MFESWKSVRDKHFNGGIDGVSIASFEETIDEHLLALSRELKKGVWISEAYLSVDMAEVRRR